MGNKNSQSALKRRRQKALELLMGYINNPNHVPRRFQDESGRLREDVGPEQLKKYRDKQKAEANVLAERLGVQKPFENVG